MSDRIEPFEDLSPSGVPGDPDEGIAPGTARVETRITGPEPAASRGGTEGPETAGLGERARERVDEARERVAELGERAREAAGAARQRLEEAVGAAEDRLDERTGALGLVREYPLLATGLAFGAGFLLAGDGIRSRGGLLGSAMGQLRAALIAGLSAALTQELRAFVDEHGGPVGVLETLTGRGGSDG